MTNIAIRDVAVVRRSDHGRRQRVEDAVFRYTTLFFALLVLVLLGGVIAALIEGSWPVFRNFGFGFVTTEEWNPVTEKFAARAPIYGTLLTSLLAMLVCVT